MFLGLGNERIGKTKSGAKAFVRASSSQNKPPAPAPAPAPAAPPPPAADPPPAPSAPPANNAPTPPPGPPPSAPPSTPLPSLTSIPGWTAEKDELLLSMKAQAKTWKEIEDALQFTDRLVLRQRYRDLLAHKGGAPSIKGDGNGDAGSVASSTAAVVGSPTFSKWKGKGKQPEKSSMKDPNKPKAGNERDTSAEHGGLKKVSDRPVIVVDEGGDLDAEQLAQLYKMHAAAEREKWIEISSRFFDKTGKRVSTDLLREKLGHL